MKKELNVFGEKITVQKFSYVVTVEPYSKNVVIIKTVFQEGGETKTPVFLQKDGVTAEQFIAEFLKQLSLLHYPEEHHIHYPEEPKKQ